MVNRAQEWAGLVFAVAVSYTGILLSQWSTTEWSTTEWSTTETSEPWEMVAVDAIAGGGMARKPGRAR